MAGNNSIGQSKRLINRFLTVSFVLVTTTLVLVITVLVVPIKIESDAEGIDLAGQLEPLTDTQRNVEPLLQKMAGRRLIRPSQVKAAVKDTGAAAQLLKKLRLQGVVQIGPDQVAYIRVEKQGTRKVKCGEKLLEFVVQKIEPGRITLSLEGVEVMLKH